MSPMKFQDDHQRSRKEMTGPRPTPLKINKDSHFINKPSSLHLSKMTPPVPAPAPAAAPATKHQHPVIIYTHSPKIIHAQARDFMALVQKLTGLSSSDSTNMNAPSPPPQDRDHALRRPSSREDNESSSVLKDEDYSGGDGQVLITSSWASPMQLNANPHPDLADIPLFTPNSGTDFFCSPRHLYRYSGQASFSSPRTMTATNPISPSFLDFMKGLPEY